MDFSDIIIIVGSFIVGYLYREFLLVKDLLRVSKNLEKNFPPKKTEFSPVAEIHKLRYETVNNIKYWYTEENGQFVCQGATLEEAAMHFTQTQGLNKIGYFFYQESNTMLCFANNAYMEFGP